MSEESTSISFEQYAAIDAVNWSSLKEMRKSPLHYEHRLRTPSTDTAARRVARAVHCAILEPQRFATDYLVFPGPIRRGKAWDEFEAAAGDKAILKTDEKQTALRIAKAVRAHPSAGPALKTGFAEFALQWKDSDTGIECKGRMDWLTMGPAGIYDVKTVDSASVGALSMMLQKHAWHCQLAFYRHGLRIEYGETAPCYLIAVEATEPHDVGVFRLDDFALLDGREQCARLLLRVAECRERKQWPGRDAGVQELRLPQWVVDANDVPVPDIKLRGGGLTSDGRIIP